MLTLRPKQFGSGRNTNTEVYRYLPCRSVLGVGEVPVLGAIAIPARRFSGV